MQKSLKIGYQNYLVGQNSLPTQTTYSSGQNHFCSYSLSVITICSSNAIKVGKKQKKYNGNVVIRQLKSQLLMQLNKHTVRWDRMGQ